MFSATNRNLLTVYVHENDDIRCLYDYLLFFHGCFNSRWCQEIMTDNAMSEDKSLVQDVALAVLHVEATLAHLMYSPARRKGDISIHIICLDSDRKISRRQRTFQTSSNTF